MGRQKKSGIYVLYKGEEIVAEGTLQEIASSLNLPYARISYLASPAAKRRLEIQELKHLPMRKDEMSVVLVEQAA